MKFQSGIICIAVLWLPGIHSASKNVLFLMADDLRPDLNFYRDNSVCRTYSPLYTPNLDSLASKSLVLRRAYSQQAVCAPSRASALTARFPDTTHVYEIGPYWREVGGNYTTIPQYFKENGYRSIGMGKIFHPGKSSGSDDPLSWTEPYYHAPNKGHYAGKESSWQAIPAETLAAMPLPDDQLVANAISWIQNMSLESPSERQPFFMAVGLHKPHLPFIFPEEFLQYYPKHIIEPPSNPYAPYLMPTVAWSTYGELRNYQDIIDLDATGDINTTLPDWKVQELRRGYYLSVTYIDQLIGNLIDAIDQAGMTDDTIVLFMGDHGFQLGEHGSWAKHTNFDLSAHVPLMLHIPGRTDGGIVTEAFTQLVDVFPTLAEAAELPEIPLCPEGQSTQTILCHEGQSLMPLIDAPDTESWREFSVFQYPRGSDTNPKMGYSLINKDYHYTEWVGFTSDPDYLPIWEDNYGTELYDHNTDPDENFNVAYEPQYADVVDNLHQKLMAGWRGALPANK